MTLLILVVLVSSLAALAQRVKTPYPIVLVLSGLILSFFPVIPHVSINPTFVFLVILPPLLFAASLNTAWREFRFNLVSIAMLGLGLVAFTVAGISTVAHFFMPEFDWRTGAVLGAVISTTDAIAVAAIASRVGLPHRVLEIIEGESLVNDATGLLALQFTTALVVSGEIPSIGGGVREFIWLICGGVAAGLLVGWFVARFDRLLFRLFQQSSEVPILVSIATPYFAYLLGEAIHSSGVLATVVCGLYLGRTTSETFSTRARLDSRVIWNTLDFVLNGFIFIVIGLQLPTVLNGMRDRAGHLNWPHMIAGAAFVAAVAIAVRMALIFPGAHLAWFLRRRLLHQQVEKPTSRELVVTGWSGMRGVLTLAAALSLPEFLDNGNPFPKRGHIIFYAFTVILVTLVGQGLSLPAIIRKLGLVDSDESLDEERKARRVLLKAALKTLRETPGDEEEGERSAAAILTRYYEQRLEALRKQDAEPAQLQQRKYQELAAKVRRVEREQILRLRGEGTFRESTLRDLERELDLLDLRWEKS
ncbi:CPA1 family monovalent cation:H+ antiporter [Silvibacterium bohemicum]|uniref:CPA1 family monovalent cation:H+ antiporter n=1 Tax=Silvibacterium bohemicum TaxID=1577686 RepID=A0A841JWR8_9BACT|nr:Na+/H+ antiporter [Silvibacterium bohemicum]MBB6145600.1 CPA1 family monovalent cation:H+ antiporter [Silvibacterium bohemicum]